MNKNIIFIPIIKKKEGSQRHEPYRFSAMSWRKWAEKNNAEVIVWDTPITDPEVMSITWQRYFLFDLLKESGIEDYGQVLMADGDTIVHPNCPNFFEMTNKEYTVVVDNGCWEWTARSIKLYKPLFNNFALDRGKYFNGGFQIVNKKHANFFRQILKFYEDNNVSLRKLQQSKLGTDQTPVNYLVQMSEKKLNFLPPTFNLSSLAAKNLLPLGHEWWGDSLQNLYDQAWVYHFNAIPANSLGRNTGYFLERCYKELYEV